MAKNKEPETFEVELNPDLDKAGYGFSVPILAADKERGEETSFMAGIPRSVTEEEYAELSGSLDGKKIVVKR